MTDSLSGFQDFTIRQTAPAGVSSDMTYDYTDVIGEMQRMQDRLRVIRDRCCEPKSNANPRLLGAVQRSVRPQQVDRRHDGRGHMIESEVVDASCAHLTNNGWEIQREVKTLTGPIDVVATRGSERLVAEAKRMTANAGLDMNTAYGQLRNRMTDPDARYAVVAPETSRNAALRVPRRVRNLLGIEVYVVAATGAVSRVEVEEATAP